MPEVTFTGVSVTIALPDGVEDPRVAYAILCKMLSPENIDTEFSTDSYSVEGREDGPTADLFPGVFEDGDTCPHVAKWDGGCLDCGQMVYGGGNAKA